MRYAHLFVCFLVRSLDLCMIGTCLFVCSMCRLRMGVVDACDVIFNAGFHAFFWACCLVFRSLGRLRQFGRGWHVDAPNVERCEVRTFWPREWSRGGEGRECVVVAEVPACIGSPMRGVWYGQASQPTICPSECTAHSLPLRLSNVLHMRVGHNFHFILLLYASARSRCVGRGVARRGWMVVGYLYLGHALPQGRLLLPVLLSGVFE